MDIYSLDIESFTIHHTRALHNDTLWLTYDGDFTPTGTVALAAVHNHLYIASPGLTPDGDTTQIWAY